MPFDNAPDRGWGDEPPKFYLDRYSTSIMLGDGTIIGGVATRAGDGWRWRWVDRPPRPVDRMAKSMFPDAPWIRAAAPRGARVFGPVWFRTTRR